MLVKQAIEILGADISISNSKMPGTAFGLSATVCQVGGLLQRQDGTVCSKCYALRLERLRPSVHAGYMKRTEQVWKLGDPEFFELWVEAAVLRIAKLTAKLGQPYHRWHDSGDLQSRAHLRAIIKVAQRLPDVKFWLPTKESHLVCKYRAVLPKNLVIRLSATKIDGKPSRTSRNTSTVHHRQPAIGWTCPALIQGNHCGDCRACWDRDVKNVSYPKH